MNLTWNYREVAEDILFYAKKNILVHRFRCAFGLIVHQPNSSNILIVMHEDAPPTTSESDDDYDSAFHFSASDSSKCDD